MLVALVVCDDSAPANDSAQRAFFCEAFLAHSHRWRVRLGPDSTVNVRPVNLVIASATSPDPDVADVLATIMGMEV